MKLFGRKTEAEKALDATKVDLAAARATLAEINSKEVGALANSVTFAAWSTERNAASAEIDRLERLTAALVSGAETQQRNEADAALRKRIADTRKANDALVARIRTDGPRLSTELKTLMRDVAKATIETIALNEDLPEGEAFIGIADFMARDTAVLPRVDLKTEELSLWVLRDSGGLVGNQDAVTAIDDETGYFDANGMRFKCAKRRFKSTTFHPALACDHPGHLFSLVRLPNFDGPGVSFDGAFLTIEQVAALNLDPPKADKKSRRPTQTELTPIGPWTPPALTPPGAVEEVNS
jgi:hypothetical protein